MSKLELKYKFTKETKVQKHRIFYFTYIKPKNVSPDNKNLDVHRYWQDSLTP